MAGLYSKKARREGRTIVFIWRNRRVCQKLAQVYAAATNADHCFGETGIVDILMTSVFTGLASSFITTKMADTAWQAMRMFKLPHKRLCSGYNAPQA